MDPNDARWLRIAAVYGGLVVVFVVAATVVAAHFIGKAW